MQRMIEEATVVAVLTARQTITMLQDQLVNMATIGSMADGTFLGPYLATADFIASTDDAAMAEAYVVTMVVPQDAEEMDGDDNGISYNGLPTM
jgi:hypothetical protein